MDQELICLWAFVMVLLLLTTFHRKENYENEMKNSGKEAGTVAHDAVYSSVYHAHSQTCSVLVKYKDDVIDMTVKFLSNLPSEPLTGKDLEGAKDEVKNLKKMLLSELSKIEEMYGIKYENIKKFVDTYVDIVANSLMNGDKPTRKFLGKQYDDFIETFCEDIDTNAEIVPLIDVGISKQFRQKSN